MKNWTKYLLALVLLFTVLLPGTAVAKDSGEANLQVYKQNDQYEVSVYLNLPEGQKGEVYSLRFKLYVIPEQGYLEANPTFKFADGIPSDVKNCEVTLEEDNEYCIDVVLSGQTPILTSDTIQKDDKGSDLGTLVGKLYLVPQTGDVASFVAEVRFGASEEDPANQDQETESESSGQAGETGQSTDNETSTTYVEYVNKGGVQVVRSHITNADVAYVGVPQNLDDCNVTIAEQRVVYNGSEQRPAVTVTDGAIVLKEGADYTLEYAENINVGTAAAIVKAKEGSMYTGQRIVNFFIDPAEAPANMPKGVIEAAKSAKTLADVPLPEGWTWKDSSIALTPGETLAEAVALYTADNKGNYKTVEAKVSVYLPKDEPAVTPENPEEPVQPDTQPQSETQQPETGAGESAQTVQNLTAKPVVGTKKVKLSWDRVSGADGYEVRVLDAETGKYKKAKTISKGDKTTYTGTYTFGEKLTFKVRAYTLDADGKTKKFGAYSKTVEVQASVFDETVHPEMSAATKNGKKKVILSWDAIKGADGYRIYLWHEDTQTYSRLAEITKGKTHTYKDAVSFQYGQRYKVKMRAYALDAGGKKKVFSKFSKVLSFKVPPAQVKDVSLKAAEGKVEITWSKVDGAKGYRVFRSTSVSGGYVRIGSAWGEDALKYTDTTAKSGNTYYYKVKAFARNPQKQRILGRMSAAKSVTVK